MRFRSDYHGDRIYLLEFLPQEKAVKICYIARDLTRGNKDADSSQTQDNKTQGDKTLEKVVKV